MESSLAKGISSLIASDALSGTTVLVILKDTTYCDAAYSVVRWAVPDRFPCPPPPHLLAQWLTTVAGV